MNVDNADNNALHSKNYYQSLKPFNSMNLVEFPIVPKGYLMGKVQIKSGGTFLRLFNQFFLKKTPLTP